MEVVAFVIQTDVVATEAPVGVILVMIVPKDVRPDSQNHNQAAIVPVVLHVKQEIWMRVVMQ